MKKFAILIVGVMLTLLFGATIVPAAPGYKNIMSVEAKKLVEQKKNLFLLDVRTPQEYAQARMKGSVLIPLNELERRVHEVPKDRPILVLCAVGSRSNLAAGFLYNKGFRDVYNLTDGLSGWHRKGFPLDMQR